MLITEVLQSTASRGKPDKPTCSRAMDNSIHLGALVDQLKDIIAQQPNLPRQLPIPSSSTNRSGSYNDIPPLPQHPIPLLPATSHNVATDSISLADLQSYLSKHILPHLNIAGLSPNYYGFITGGSTPAALLSDWLVSLYDQNVQVHLPSDTIATSVEVATLNQLISLVNLPSDTWSIGSNSPGGGTFTTGATASNVLGLAMGREFVIRAAGIRNTNTPNICVAADGLLPACLRAGITNIQILSTLPHSSIAKAASVVGIGRTSIHSVLKPDTSLELDLPKITHLASTPNTATILAISAGEVNTGHFATTGLSGWKSLRTLCDSLSIWIHVDAAFGLFARLLPSDDAQYTHLTSGVEGIELADSITGDAHKMLNVPYDCGIFLTRHKQLCEAVFVNNAAYLSSPTTSKPGGSGGGGGGGDGIQSPLNIGIENSRRFRALPVHATLTTYGRRGYEEMLKCQIGLARRVVRWLWGQEGYQVLPEIAGGEEGGEVEEAVAKTYMIVLFRARDERVNEELVGRINGEGRIYVSGTVWKGKKAARIAVANWMCDVARDGRIIEDVLTKVLAG